MNINQRIRTYPIVFILGSSEWPSYEELSPSESFKRSAERFKDYLLSDSFGLPQSNLVDLFCSQKAPHEQLKDIRLSIKHLTEKKPQEVYNILFYYTGHGGFDKSQRYCLTTYGTQRECVDLTAIPVETLASTFKSTRINARFFLILDCCFAASACEAFQSDSHNQLLTRQIKSSFPEKGVTILCASSKDKPAQAPPELKYTMFSEALLDVLEKGDSTKEEFLSFEDLGELVTNRIQQKYSTYTKPELHSPNQSDGDIRRVPFFPNIAYGHYVDDYDKQKRIQERNIRRLTEDQLSLPTLQSKSLEGRIDNLEKKINHQKDTVKIFLRSFKEFSFYHQRKLIEASLKMANAVDLILTEEDSNSLSKRVIKFHNKSQSGILNLCQEIVNPLDDYFKLSSRIPPRITIKILKIHENEECIVDFFRRDRSYLNYIFKVSENTAFSSINSGEPYYYCNNIPAEAKSGNYKNSRLVKKLVEKYVPQPNSIDRDLEWEKCWLSYENLMNKNSGKNRLKRKSIKSHVAPSSCYKSTLVIPIVINELEDNDIKNTLGISAEYNQIIFGYVCFDNHKTDYFEYEYDLNVGFIFSSILSFYFFNYYRYGNSIRHKVSSLTEKMPNWQQKIFHKEIIFY